MNEIEKRAILCVDDEKIILKSLKDQLRSHFNKSIHLEFAESAQEGIEIIEEFNDEGVEVLVIVSDWLMPGMRGDEFLIRVHEKFPRIKKIMLTGQADPVAVRNAEENANLYKLISKPWDEADLIHTIKECIM
jgi:CheY-like chemotaxis protein